MLRIFRRSDPKPQPPQSTGFNISSAVTASVHADGVVFLHSAKGVVFSSNRVGASIWKGVCAGRSVAEISGDVSRRFDAPREAVHRDTVRFLGELVAEGILKRAAA
jgi:hypothetical protein